jgi:hypothetical protein
MNGSINSANFGSFTTSAAAAAAPSSATAIMDEHDAKLHTFLYLLSEESQRHHSSNINSTQKKQTTATAIAATGGGRTTVPAPLTRRILNRQGVNFIDETVGSIVSLAADKFLAIVLSQSVACRDHRVEGEEVRNRQKRLQEKIDRKRKRKTMQAAQKKQAKEALKQAKESLVQANHLLSQASAGTTGNIDTTAISDLLPAAASIAAKPKTKKEMVSTLQHALTTAHSNLINMEKKLTKKTDSQNMKNAPLPNSTGQPSKLSPSTSSDDDNDDEDEWMEEEEDKGQSDDEDDEEEDDEKRYVLQLCDIVRPLESWGVHLNGRIGLLPSILNNRTEQQGKKETVAETQQQEEKHEEHPKQHQVTTSIKQRDHPSEKRKQQQQQQGHKKFVPETTKNTLALSKPSSN